jgi:hypothetical protein
MPSPDHPSSPTSAVRSLRSPSHVCSAHCLSSAAGMHPRDGCYPHHLLTVPSSVCTCPSRYPVLSSCCRDAVWPEHHTCLRHGTRLRIRQPRTHRRQRQCVSQAESGQPVRTEGWLREWEYCYPCASLSSSPRAALLIALADHLHSARATPCLCSSSPRVPAAGWACVSTGSALCW